MKQQVVPSDTKPSRTQHMRIAESFDKLSPGYGTPTDGGRPDLQAKVRKVAAGLVAKGSHGNILDAGCGNGALTLSLAKHGHYSSLVGVDFSWGMLRVLADRVEALEDQRGHDSVERLHLSQALLERLPFASGAFDTVICVNTLHNLCSEEAVRMAVGELIRVCKANGELILEIHNASNPVVRRHFARYSKPHMPTIPYTVKWLRSVLEQGGFAVRRKVPVGLPVATIAPFVVIKAERANLGNSQSRLSSDVDSPFC